ncbi:hypothetical protein PG985_005325 [Apiospora marii]|uniref:Uncharacterized protein n=1 Tax=Apiospora marii TaxID=335849 RepID=A0ABR1SDG7_9PEZI
MFSSSLLLASLAGLAASLPNEISVRTTRAAGNPFLSSCTPDQCLSAVVGAALPAPSKALEDCSAFLQQSTSMVTARATPVTVTITQAQSGAATSTTTAYDNTTTTTTVGVPVTVFDTVSETDTVTETSQVTATSVVTSLVTVTGLDLSLTTLTQTSTSVETDVTTSVQTIAPQKRDVLQEGPKIKGRCKHPQGTTSSSMLSLPSGCTNAVEYASACACAVVSATAVTVTLTHEAEPATVTATVVVVTETLTRTAVSTVTESHSTTETLNATALVSATVQVTDIALTTTTQTVYVTNSSTDIVTTTLVVPTTTTTTTVQTVTAAAPSGPSCPAVPPTCAQPSFRLQVANGTAAGDYLVARAPGPREILSYIILYSADPSKATTFTLDAGGVLFANVAAAPGPPGSSPLDRRVYYLPQAGSDGEPAGLVPRPGAAYRPLYAQTACGPRCPATMAAGATGTLLITGAGANGAFDTFGYCNGKLTVTVGGGTGYCSGGSNEGYTIALTYTVV